MKKFLKIWVITLLLSSCNSAPTTDVETPPEQKQEENDVFQFTSNDHLYHVILPFKESNKRLVHSSYTGNLNDIKEITRRLQQLSLKYWPFEDYYMAEDRGLPYDLYRNLLLYSSVNELGLNPEKFQEFETTRSGVTIDQAVIIGDVFELDFYETNSVDAPLAGVAFAITLNRNFTRNGISYQLPMDLIHQYGQSAARKLVSVLRTRPEFSTVPILVGLYSLNKDDQNLPGNFISQAYFEAHTGQFEEINDSWVIYPSSQATNTNSEVAVEFNLFSRAISDFLQSEVVGVVGKGRLIEGQLDQLSVEVILTAKTYLEIQGIAQFVANQLVQFEQFNVNIVVDIKNHQSTVAVVELKRNQSSPSIIIL